MYFPYLRGRQFELIAIRELIERSLLSKHVVPIVEPVKLSAALIKTLNSFKDKRCSLGIVRNPQVGTMLKDLIDEKNFTEKEKYFELRRFVEFLTFLYADENLSDYISEIERDEINRKDISTICVNQDAIAHFESVYSVTPPEFNLIPDESVYRKRMPNRRVLFEDRFLKKSRNVGYLEQVDQPYSSDHLYYSQDGYMGFSDYSIVGEEYSESGFAPYAIAIHIVYFADDRSLRVHHFVSDTNEDITDPAGKFAEALEKLVKWNQIKKDGYIWN